MLGMKYPIVFCDYDGTIFDADAQCVPAPTLAAIARYIRAGGLFVVTTGRMYPSIKAQLARYGLERQPYIICMQGSVTYRADSDSILFCHDLEAAEWQRVAHFVEGRQWVYQVYHDTRFFTAFANDYSAAYARYTGVQPVVVGQPLTRWQQAAQWSMHKMIVMTPPAEAADRIDILRAAFPRLDISQSSDIYIEIVSPASGKGNAVTTLYTHLGFTRDQTMAFGDATNDVSLLQAVGMGVAVGNAYAALKAVADYVCAPCAQCGVADVLDAVVADAF